MIGLALALAGALFALVDEDQGSLAADPHHLARVRTVVEDGHVFLVEHQNADGSFSVVRRQSASSAPVAVTALAALSFMAGGELPERGRHSEVVRRALDWLVKRCDDRGYFYYEGDEVSRMHGQGYALLALTQAYGMYGEPEDKRERMRQAIERAVGLIEETQGERGGWWYAPEATSSHENSITVTLVQALRAARDAGFAVDRGVIDSALQYVKDCQDPATGRFRYAINDPRSSWALTAAALSTLNALGRYDSAELDLGFDAMRERDPLTGEGGDEFFFDYGALYAAQAYWQQRDRRHFDAWWQAYVEFSEERQFADGRFTDGQYGDVYATAIVTLTLQVPLGYLPVFQR